MHLHVWSYVEDRRWFPDVLIISLISLLYFLRHDLLLNLELAVLDMFGMPAISGDPRVLPLSAGIISICHFF